MLIAAPSETIIRRASKAELLLELQRRERGHRTEVLRPAGRCGQSRQAAARSEGPRLGQGLRRAGKPVASICHGPWLLVAADVLRGRRATAWYSIRTDLKNVGATIVDEEVVLDGNIITSRMPSDLPAFNRAIVAALRTERKGTTSRRVLQKEVA